MKYNPLVLLFILLTINGKAQIEKSGLFLGNSYTYANDLPLMIHKIAYSKGNAFKYSSHTPGGYLLGIHSVNEISLGKIDTESFDYLILQEQSISLANATNGYAKYFHRSFAPAEYLHHRSQLIDTCRKTLLYVTWGRKKDHPFFVGPPYYYGDNYNGMQDNITSNYSQIGFTIGAEIAPVGEVWRRVVNTYPNLDLYTPDGSHPNPIGTYVAACVFYESMFQDGLKDVWRPHTVPDTIAEFIHMATDEILSQNWSRWNISSNESSCIPGGLQHNTEDWSDTLISPYTTISEVHFYNSNHGYIKGSKETLMQTIDGGESWQTVELPDSNPVMWNNENSFGVFFSNPDTIWYAVGGDEIDSSTLVFTGISGRKGEFNSFIRVFRSVNGGDSWEERSPEKLDYQQLDSGLIYQRPTFSDFSIYFEDDLRGTIICSYGGNDTIIYSYWTDDGGLTWNENKNVVGRVAKGSWIESLTVAYKSGFKDSSGYVDAPLKLYKTEDRGRSWTETAALPDNCCKPLFYNIEHEISSFTKQGDTLIALNSVFAPVVYQSTDGGTKWDSIGKINVIGTAKDIVKLSNGVLLMPVEGRFGRILASYDNGKNWDLEAFFPYGIRDIAVTSEYIFAVDSWGGMYKKKTSLISPPERPATESFNVFPNPSNGLIHVVGVQANRTIDLLSSNGQLVRSFESNSNGNASMELEEVKSGLYFIQVHQSDGTLRKKLLIIK